MGEFCTVLSGPVHQVLSAIRINGVSAFQGDIWNKTNRWDFKSVSISRCPFSGVSARWDSTVYVCISVTLVQ